MKTLILANGELHFSPSLIEIAQNSDVIIAADGGGKHCIQLQCSPDYIIGDLDSIPEDLLNSFKDEGVEVLQFPTRKDATDLELALDHALKKGATHISFAGLLGGRWDMSLSNLLLLTQGKYNYAQKTIYGDRCIMHILHPGNHSFHPGYNQRASLLPIKNDAGNVTLQGFEYPLEGYTIPFGSSIGISNVTCKTQVKIQFTSGTLLLIFSL